MRFKRIKYNINRNSELPIAQKGEEINNQNTDYPSFQEINNNALVQTAKIFDPTGISSYPDVYYSGKDLYNNPSWGNAANFGLNLISALPVVGKVAVPLKVAKTASKIMNSSNKVARTLSKVDPNVINATVKNFNTINSKVPKIVKGGARLLKSPGGSSSEENSQQPIQQKNNYNKNPNISSNKSISEIYNIKGDNTWEYSKDSTGNWVTRKKGSNSNWNMISKSNLNKNKANEAINRLESQAYKVNNYKYGGYVKSRFTINDIYNI